MTNVNLTEWIKHISSYYPSLKGYSICPFAKEAKFQIIETTSSLMLEMDFFLDNNDLIILAVEENISIVDLDKCCKALNVKHKNFIFLPDHKDKQTYIQDIQTNNGLYNLVLCQDRKKLESFRDKLKLTGYYDLWTETYYNEILSY